LAVDLFFSLSGFIFYWLYSKPIFDHTISPTKFFILRFSRLYPLHFLTLVIVAILQLWSVNLSGDYFVYSNNDDRYFLLNIFFICSWGILRAQSFNGPAWSVSVEILLYVVFFACCRLLPKKLGILMTISVIGFLIAQFLYSPIGRGIWSFFLGGCVFLIYKTIISSDKLIKITTWSKNTCIFLWTITLLFIFLGLRLNSQSSFQFLFDLHKIWNIRQDIEIWAVVVLFPITILSLSLTETAKGSFGKQISFLGDVSYSTYLLHFPLQILLFILISRFTSSRSIYYSPWFMICFFIILISISAISYRYFEMPLQKLLRKTALNKRSNGHSH
jgi:peptidoglycan/LPS O-acetylase OafA/YrhL